MEIKGRDNLNDMKIIEEFEQTIAEFAGSKYGVLISSCTNAIFLSLLYLKSINEISENTAFRIPRQTYVSVPMSIINAGFKIKFELVKWSGVYQLKPTRIYDSAVRFKKGMYISDSLYCVSFQYRKHIPIGRGGMVLTDEEEAYNWLRQARHNGKHPGISKWDDEFEIIGWDMYMRPVDALLGLTLFKKIENTDIPDCGTYKDYPDLIKQKVFNEFL